MRGLNRVVGVLMTAVIIAAPCSLTAQSPNAQQYQAYGNKLYAAKNYTQAIQYFNAAIKLDPNNGAVYQAAGNSYYALGNKKYALTYYQKASALQPSNAALAQFVQNLSAQVNAGAGAGTGSTASTGASSPAASQYLAAGNKLYAEKNYTQAIQYFNAAIKADPNNAAAYQVAGNSYYALGNKKYALPYYQKASALQPSNTALAQFVQNLSAQVGSGAVGTTASAGNDYLSKGASLFQQKQYAASLPYFRGAIQQNPNDYKGYYYSGYAYYMTGNAKLAAFYFGVANAKQPNASIKAYADRIKSSLPSDGQQWVDDMVAKYSTGGTAVAGGAGSNKKSDIDFGFHIRMGGEYILADPAQITGYVQGAKSVSLTGLTPNIIPFPEIEPYIQISKAFEINLAFGYFPVGNLSYTTFDFGRVNPNDGLVPDVWSYTFNTNIITADLGAKILFGDKDVTGYFGLSGGISPISMTFTKLSMDSTNTNKMGTDDSSGEYTSMAINGQALLGMDISLGKGLALGPYVGFRYLNATDFKKGGSTLAVDTKTGAVGMTNVGVSTIPNSTNLPLGDPTAALTLDFTGIIGGVDLTFSF